MNYDEMQVSSGMVFCRNASMISVVKPRGENVFLIYPSFKEVRFLSPNYVRLCPSDMQGSTSAKQKVDNWMRFGR